MRRRRIQWTRATPRRYSVPAARARRVGRFGRPGRGARPRKIQGASLSVKDALPLRGVEPQRLEGVSKRVDPRDVRRRAPIRGGFPRVLASSPLRAARRGPPPRRLGEVAGLDRPLQNRHAPPRRLGLAPRRRARVVERVFELLALAPEFRDFAVAVRDRAPRVRQRARPPIQSFHELGARRGVACAGAGRKRRDIPECRQTTSPACSGTSPHAAHLEGAARFGSRPRESQRSAWRSSASRQPVHSHPSAAWSQ